MKTNTDRTSFFGEETITKPARCRTCDKPRRHGILQPDIAGRGFEEGIKIRRYQTGCFP